jgi:poly(3-hydroxybutyrate) depolymerase
MQASREAQPGKSDSVYRSLVHSCLRGFLLSACLVAAGWAVVCAQHYVEREIRIPRPQAGPAGLAGLLVYVDLPGKHPLVVLTHGSARVAEEHALVSPWQQLPQALWFARRGWIVQGGVHR